MEEYRSIIANLKNKNIKGLETLSNKYLKEYILSGDEKLLKMSVISKALSYFKDIEPANLEELFYQDLESINDAKEAISIKLHNSGYTYSRISELLMIDLINIINILRIDKVNIPIHNEVFLDQSAILLLAKANMLDIIDFLDLSVITYLDSNDIRARAIKRSKRIKIIDPIIKTYPTPFYLSAKPVYFMSFKELSFIEQSNIVLTADQNILNIMLVKEKLENYSNRLVMIDEIALEELNKILSKVYPLEGLIGYAINKGYDIGAYEKTIYLD